MHHIGDALYVLSKEGFQDENIIDYLNNPQ